ncbi:transposase [Acidovorax sp.]|uniref:transposase n=1 Tax=Acidovorax sp. TaxID=1872122 RepID=UPI003D01923D
MKRFIEGEDRQQVTMLPECLDDYIAQDNPVRVVDVFVEELDLPALGFDGANPAVTGRPAYHPAVLLKLYIYGYLNRIQSSRRLEREAQRNVELMWLTGRLAPDFKTIADFRRSNGAGIRNVCKRFIAMCRQLNLFSQAIVAIDGSKFKAVNSRDRNFTPGKIEARQQQIEQSIQRYLDALETADRTQPAEVEARTERLQEKLQKLREQMRQLDGLKEQLKSLPDGQVSLTDPDARSMTTQAKGSGLVGYNVQTAVDGKHHLIVAHEVTNVGFVPKPMTSNAKAEGRFDKGDFIYIAKDDEYQCPAGERAIHRFRTVEKGLSLSIYWSSACPKCPLKAQCTTSSNRRIRRWEHEEVLERVQQRLDSNPEAMTLRRSTVEHVFGTLKHWMGSTHFLMKTLKHVGTEMSLHVLAYNLKRVMGVMGIAQMMQAMRMAKA